MHDVYREQTIEKINAQSPHYKLVKSQYEHYTVEPMPSESELVKFYTSRYFRDSTAIANKGMDIGDKDPKERFHHDRQYSEIDTFLKKTFASKDIAILDVGCGTGHLLTFLKHQGYNDLSGTEYDCAFSLEGIKIFNGGFLSFETEKKYDMIMFNNVLEHVINPEAFINKAYTILKPNGYIRVQVPNDLSYPQLKATEQSSNYYFFCPPEHLHYFTFKSMQNFLHAHRFQVTDQMTTWSMDLFVLMGLDYSKDPVLGKQCHRQRVNMEYALGEEYLLQMYKQLATIGLGRVVIEYAKKV